MNVLFWGVVWLFLKGNVLCVCVCVCVCVFCFRCCVFRLALCVLRFAFRGVAVLRFTFCVL
jgi:hypothetical protein